MPHESEGCQSKAKEKQDPREHGSKEIETEILQNEWDRKRRDRKEFYLRDVVGYRSVERVAKDKLLVPDLPKGYQSNHLIFEMLTSSTTIQEPFFSHWEYTSAFIFKQKVYFLK